MTKKTTKSALLMSSMSLLLCFAMLLGTTFAWFTDSVTSSGNIIKAGTLDVEMYYADGKEAPATASWTDASTGAIFNYDKWEPGYVEVKHIKIENKGTLALKYNVSIVANGAVSDLSDVIDVYYADPAVQVSDRTDLVEGAKIGTLTQVLANLSTTANGTLEAGDDDVITLAFKMQESAGNEYQNKAIGSDFSVKLVATQLESEEDSFDASYDEKAEYDVVVESQSELVAALANAEDGDVIALADDVVADGNATIAVAAGKDITLDLNGNTLSAEASKSGNQELFNVQGEMTVKNGTVELTATNNQGWGAMATIFDVTAGGVLNLDGVTAKVGGTDMNFIVHLNNWGEATLNVNNCDFTATYVAVRVFNSGYDMNNVTIKNTDFHNGRMLWVHNYTSEGKDDSTLNLNIYNNNNTCDNVKPVRFGFDVSTYYDLSGNIIS